MGGQRACLILNGKQASNEAVRAAVYRQRLLGRELAVRLTWEAADVPRLVDEALALGVTQLVAGGGDGTHGAVAGALCRAGGGASLALLPQGTANDFAGAAGIPADPGAALALLDGPAVSVDLGQMNDQFFLNMATVGTGARLTASTPEDLKRFLGGSAYLLAGLGRFADVQVGQGRFRGPDFFWEGDFLAFAAGNGRQAGGGQLLCPQACIDDGLLDVCIIPAPAGAMGTLGTLLASGLGGLEAVSLMTRLPWLEVQLAEPLAINLDGEPVAGRKLLRFASRPGQLALHLPAGSPLLQANARRADAREMP